MNKINENPANAIKDTMWTFLMYKGQESNIPALKEYVYELIKATTQKNAGQRKETKGKNFDWQDLDILFMAIVCEATALVLSGDLDKLEQDEDDSNATEVGVINNGE